MNIQPVNLRSFRQKVRYTRTKMRRFLTRIEKTGDRDIDRKINILEKETWVETDCLSCANCCKTMTPTFNPSDIKRISAHLNMTTAAFKDKWLHKERGGDRDWLNKTEPCQFLDLKDNKCSIYEVRPADCAGYPHLSKKFKDYAHVYKQNIECCPATYRLVEKMMEMVRGER